MRTSSLFVFLLTGALFLACFLNTAAQSNSGRKPVPLGAQPDLRFVVKAERIMNNEGDEEYFFYVINTTNQEYRLKIKVTLQLACYGTKVFYLGYTESVYLKPNSSFTPRDDNPHVYMGAKAESRKGCVLKDEEGKLTFFKGAIFHMADIENITLRKSEEKRRLEEEIAAKQKIEEEGKRAEEQKRKDAELAQQKKQEEEQKKKDETIKKKQETENQNKASAPANTSATVDDFWTEKSKTTSTGNNASTNPNYHKLPDVFYTTTGQYWKKQDGEIVEITKEEYTRLKTVSKTSSPSNTSSESVQTAEEKQKIIDKYIADSRAQQEAYQRNFDEINRKYEVNNQAGQMQQNINETKNALNENTTMGKNYQNPAQVMADFRQKMSAINQTTKQLHQQRQEKLNYVTNNYYAPDDQAGQIASQGIKVIGTFVNAAKAEKERKEAQAQLKAEKEAALRYVEEQERKLLSGIRTDLFSGYKEVAFPTSTSKINATTLYFFSYAYDPAQIGAKQAVLFISNVFRVDQYSDGTWPFKNSIVSEISKLTP